MGKCCACHPMTAFTQMLMESLESKAEVMFLIVPLNANFGLDCRHLLAPLIDFTEWLCFCLFAPLVLKRRRLLGVFLLKFPAGRKAESTLLSNEILNWTFKTRSGNKDFGNGAVTLGVLCQYSPHDLTIRIVSWLRLMCLLCRDKPYGFVAAPFLSAV